MTTDACNCQRAIAEQITAQGGDYALALEGDQPSLHADVVPLFDDPDCKVASSKPDVDAGHGRIETRTASVSADIAALCDVHRWPGMATIGKVVRERETADHVSLDYMIVRFRSLSYGLLKKQQVRARPHSR